RVTLNSKTKRYEIGNVVAVNESLVGVSNDAYTNAVAKKNLELAVRAGTELHRDVNPKWREIAAKMYVPASDSALLWFPLEMTFSNAQTRAAIKNMLAHRRLGAMMGTEFYPILAAQLGDRQLIGKLLTPFYAPYLRAPFNVIAETPDNKNINFITGAGAFLQQFIFGYSGMRLDEKGLERKYQPILPPGITHMTLRNFTVRGQLKTFTY
ncbi:MAG: hypothetical protein JOZ43_01815, partial [Acidobacteriales bacterium]|nr:hypothetical protein [Terriglobales bacterium]